MTDGFNLYIFTREILQTLNLGDITSSALSITAIIIILATLAFISHFLTQKLLLKIVSIYVKKSRTNWDDLLLKRHFFSRLAHLVPAIVIYLFAELLPATTETLQRLSGIYLILVGLFVFDSLFNSILDIYRTYDISKKRPIKGYIQVLKLLLYTLGGVIVLSMILGRSPVVFLSGLGAMTAILILVFKDSILGLVAGVQLTANDMVRIGDWIEMPKYNADGDVIDITLNTVMVRNWDQTITTIPAYSLVSDSFKNWRGMTESGGRRIKRAVNIDMQSIRFCDDTMLKNFRGIQYISDYIDKKTAEIEKSNLETGANRSNLANGRNLTNIGTFRAYIAAYLHHHPKVHNNMTFLVRHRSPTEHGLPVEIYVFSNDQAWANYEAIQADIFDHLLAVIPEFELRVFQRPTGHDLMNIAGTASPNVR